MKLKWIVCWCSTKLLGYFFFTDFSLSPRVFPFFHIIALTASSSLPAALVARRHDPHERSIRLLQDNRRQAAAIERYFDISDEFSLIFIFIAPFSALTLARIESTRFFQSNNFRKMIIELFSTAARFIAVCWELYLAERGEEIVVRCRSIGLFWDCSNLYVEFIKKPLSSCVCQPAWCI